MALLKNQENVDFKMPEDLSDINMEDPQLRNALAEASVREVLAEMCDTIKDISYSKDGMELFKNHEIAAILYLAGATSFMVKHLNLPTKLIREMVPLILTRLDVNPEISTAIMGQLGHYIHTPRHVILFDRGVTDAKMRIENTTVIYTYEDVLNQWLTLNEGVEPNGFFTAVLFTDIEDFTAQTQNKGESWMIDVLHAHNDIIRQILNALSGNEIKHTGDGILATFSNVHKALQAAVTIQRGVDIFCKAMPNRSFKIRIGISAGDIISIDNDIFGAPVNLAARIMNQIKGGQIVTTDQVYGMTHESDFNYENQGEVELKGLQPQQIYLLNWQEGIEQQEASTNLVKDLESKT
jgi:adenylate cyclase